MTRFHRFLILPAILFLFASVPLLFSEGEPSTAADTAAVSAAQTSDLSQVRTLYSNAKYQQALEQVNTILEKNPYYREALLLKGQVYFKLEEPAKAYGIWTNMLRLDPSYLPVLLVLSKFHFDRSEFSSSIGDCLKILALEPLNQEAKLRLAGIHIIQGHYTEATSLLEEVNHLNPLNAGVYYLYGEMYMKQKRISDAKANYLKCRDLDPGYAPASSRLAAIMQMEKDENAGEYYLNQAVDLDRQNLDYYSGLGEFYLRKKEWKRVNDIYRTIEPRFSSNPVFYHNYSVIASRLKKPEEAILHLKKALKLNSEDPFAQILYFYTLKASSDTVSRREFASIQFKKANELYDAGDSRDAVYFFRKGLMLDPSSEENRYVFANCYKKLGYQKLYLKELQIACDLDPSQDKWAFQLERDLHRNKLTAGMLKNSGDQVPTPTRLLIVPFEQARTGETVLLDAGLLLARDLAVVLNNYYRIDADVYEDGGDWTSAAKNYDFVVRGTFQERNAGLAADSLRIDAGLYSAFELSRLKSYAESLSQNGRAHTLLKNLSRKIYADTPFSGQIFRIDNDRIYVNLGRIHDVTQNDLLTVYRPSQAEKFAPGRDNILGAAGALRIEQLSDDFLVARPADPALLKILRLNDRIQISREKGKK
jgi:tetratricopeptide (TPR) repeat protein